MGFLSGFDVPGEKEGDGRYVIKETLAKIVTLGAYNKEIIFDYDHKEFTFHRSFLWGLITKHDVLNFDDLSHIDHDYKQEIHRDEDGRRRREEKYQVSIVSKARDRYHIWTFSDGDTSRRFLNVLQGYTDLPIR